MLELNVSEILLIFFNLYSPLEPAAIVVRPSLYSSVKASQNIRITCVGYGDPTPVISWSRYSGGPLVNGSDSVRIHELNKTVNGTEFAISVLEICSLHVNHTDQYTCVAKNGVQGRGIADDSASFYIFAAPNIQSLNMLIFNWYYCSIFQNLQTSWYILQQIPQSLKVAQLKSSVLLMANLCLPLCGLVVMLLTSLICPHQVPILLLMYILRLSDMVVFIF